MVTKEWMRPATSGEGQIFSRLWAADEPKAILLLAHGMAEHSGRYSAFGSYLAQKGWVVCMNDHAGHGKSALTQGYFAEQNGWSCVVNDLHNLLEEVMALYPGLPVCMMGHSMGSFLTREFITRWGGGLSGTVLCGTMGKNPALGLAAALADLQCKIKGPKSPGKLLDKLSTGSYYKKFSNPVNQFAWLSANRENCLAYAADPACGFLFTASAFRDLFRGVQAISGEAWAQKVPKNLPILLVSGQDDPVGSMGKGPEQVASWLKAAGVEDVSLTLYPGMRHEILNEDAQQTVFEEIEHWLSQTLPGIR